MNNIERIYVHDTYQKIAERFNKTRNHVWKGVKDYLDKIDINKFIIEIGSGNGRNLLYKKFKYRLAIDLCKNFALITSKKKIESIVGNNISIPLRDNVCDYILSIAVIHHFTSEKRRLKAIEEIIRILKPNGKAFIQVWAFEQPSNTKNKFLKQDVYVNFNNPKKNLNGIRFYHVFKKNELENLCLTFKNIKIIKTEYEHGNWIVIIKKL